MRYKRSQLKLYCFSPCSPPSCPSSMSHILLLSWCPHSLPSKWPLLLPSQKPGLHPSRLPFIHSLHHNFSGIFGDFHLLNMFTNLSIYVPFQCNHSSSHHHHLSSGLQQLPPINFVSPFALVPQPTSHQSSREISFEIDLANSLLRSKTSMVCGG